MMRVTSLPVRPGSQVRRWTVHREVTNKVHELDSMMSGLQKAVAWSMARLRSELCHITL